MTHIKLNIGWPLFLTSHTVLTQCREPMVMNKHIKYSFSKALIFTQSSPLLACSTAVSSVQNTLHLGTGWSMLRLCFTVFDQNITNVRLFLLVVSHVIKSLTNLKYWQLKKRLTRLRRSMDEHWGVTLHELYICTCTLTI